MAQPKVGIMKRKTIHYSVGAVIEKDEKYLLIDRKNPPYGFACPAGHVDEGEEPLEALIREVKEETGLDVVSCELVFEELVENNRCSHGIETHFWYVYKCEVRGHIVRNMRETKSIGWYGREEISKMELEPVWKYWFKKLGVLS